MRSSMTGFISTCYTDGDSLSGSCINVQVSAYQLGAFVHPHQAEVTIARKLGGRQRSIEINAVITDGQLDLPELKSQREFGL